jgi:hypothetical protein
MERAKESSEIGGGIMGEYRKKYDEDFKKNAVKWVYAKISDKELSSKTSKILP